MRVLLDSNLPRAFAGLQNLRFQQNLSGCTLRILVIKASSNRVSALAPCVPAVLTALQDMQPGELRTIVV